MAMRSLCMVYFVYDNSEVEFTVHIPWSGNEGVDAEDILIKDALDYLRDNFGLDHMLCMDSWVEWDILDDINE